MCTVSMLELLAILRRISTKEIGGAIRDEFACAPSFLLSTVMKKYFKV
jgi:hypothetical protein